MDFKDGSNVLNGSALIAMYACIAHLLTYLCCTVQIHLVSQTFMVFFVMPVISPKLTCALVSTFFAVAIDVL